MHGDTRSKAKQANCSCALLRRNTKFLLALRSPKKRFYPGVWDMPAGHVRAGESIHAALLREVKEEIAVVPTSFNLIHALNELHPVKNGAAIYFIFLVTQWSGGEPRINNDEHTQLRWCTIDEASQLQLADERYLDLFRLALAHDPADRPYHDIPPSVC